MLYSPSNIKLGRLREDHKKKHHFFPDSDHKCLAAVHKSLSFGCVDDDRHPESEIHEELELRFEREVSLYVVRKLARKPKPRTLIEGEKFPVKSWLERKWEPPLEEQVLKQRKKKRKVEEGKGGGHGSDSQSQYQDLLLRNDGTKVDLDSLVNKYVLLCFFFVPTLVSCESLSQRLRELSSELYANEIFCKEFEIVMVVKMRKGWENSEEAFSQFVHSFPPQCLAVPFHPSSHREHLFDSSPFYDFPAALLVGPGGYVLQVKLFDDFFSLYGSAQFYPFTNKELKDICESEDKIEEMLTTGLGYEKCPLPPCKLLSDSPRDFELQHSLTGEHIHMSELISNAGEHLWFYVCQRGFDLLPILSKFCKHCNAAFNVVLVYSMCGANISDFVKIINDALVVNSTSCWVLPFDNSVSHRLWRLCGRPHKDKLICVELNGKYVDPYAAKVFWEFGVDAYPFTRRQVIVKEHERLRRVNLKSLFSESGAKVFNDRNVKSLNLQTTTFLFILNLIRPIMKAQGVTIQKKFMMN